MRGGRQKQDGIPSWDVVVIGAGPTGATAALAFAKKGARVLLADANPDAAKRFAGEWMHPPAVRALRSLGVNTETLGTATGHGFVLFGDDGAPPVELPYVRGTGLSRVHHHLVEDLRGYAAANSLVNYRTQLAFSRFDGELVEFEDKKSGSLLRVRAGLVIGADGRRSRVAAALGVKQASAPLSYMMGVELRGVRLPYEGMGHVIFGGPGPALLYRVDDDMVRGCLDVPVAFGTAARKKQNVYDAFRPFLPPEFERAFQEALEHATPWAATRFQPRSYFGTSRVWLLGDAVGHVHPISGMGMTFGILDAVAAASAASLGQYRSAREVYVSELLTNLLYTVFQRHDASATRVRHALLKMLRKSPTERRRTMQILTSETDDARSFALSFMKASRYAVQDRVLGQPLSHESRAHRHHESSQNWASSAPDPSSHGRFGVPGALRLAEALKEDASWFKWPLSALVSEVSGLRAHRAQSTIERPFPEFSDMLSSGTRLLRERAPLGRSLHALTLGRKISARP